MQIHSLPFEKHENFKYIFDLIETITGLESPDFGSPDFESPDFMTYYLGRRYS